MLDEEMRKRISDYFTPVEFIALLEEMADFSIDELIEMLYDVIEEHEEDIQSFMETGS